MNLQSEVTHSEIDINAEVIQNRPGVESPSAITLRDRLRRDGNLIRDLLLERVCSEEFPCSVGVWLASDVSETHWEEGLETSWHSFDSELAEIVLLGVSDEE